MASILSNGATLIIFVLLVLTIAFRYYSAFIAAKVVALDDARITPAHRLKDGHNYHPTNKWVLFGHHFAAISGAGPLIGPVLAAQFGYLPGLLWILIGVVLAGAVQDFVVLALSIRRNGRSLAQMAFSDIGPASGTAATIGILFVLVIALAGLGKVVTKALGGEKLTYDAGTQFVAPENSAIQSRGNSGSEYTYQIPAGTKIVYPNKVVSVVPDDFELVSDVQSGDPVDIESQAVPAGTRLMVSAGGVAAREGVPAETYPAGSSFYADEASPITTTANESRTVYTYHIPAGARIVKAGQPMRTAEQAFDLVLRAAPIGTSSAPTRTRLTIPFGMDARPLGKTNNYPPETSFEADQQPIQARGKVNDQYLYTIPAGTRIVDPQGNATRVEAAFDLAARPLDITVTAARGARLIVPEKAGVSVYQEFAGSTWGTFTIALTIPIALFVGMYLYRIRKGRVLEASIIGGLMTLVAVYLGGQMNSPDSGLFGYREFFNLSEGRVGIAMAIYGFVASILPVWMLLCPRDYLSSFLKIGTIALLVVGVIVAHPHLHAPALNGVFLAKGPVVAGPVYPFVFITIMCGAVSGFHALVSSGTTPKMINRESDARTIGYGAMLMEGLVGIVALIAASALPVHAYYEINTPPKDMPVWQAKIQEVEKNDRAAILDEKLPDVGEHVQGRTGGAVTLAMGMASVLNGAVNTVIGSPEKPPAWLGDLYKYWYHFAIMFEALFILTTIDTGTRVGRFLLQESMGKWIHPKLGKTDWWFSAVLSTALISAGWWYFLQSSAFAAIWAMFGIANQMLAVMALAIASAALCMQGKRRYAWVTLAPMVFVLITTASAAGVMLTRYIEGMKGKAPLNPTISAVCVIAILLCTAIVVIAALMRVMGRMPPRSMVEAEPAPSTAKQP